VISTPLVSGLRDTVCVWCQWRDCCCT